MLKLRHDIKSVAMLCKTLTAYKTDESKNVFEQCEWHPDFVYHVCESSFHFFLTYDLKCKTKV